MSNYTKSTNFATKDNLTPGDPLKIVRGTEIDTEFNNIATAIATKTDNASAAITGGSITGITDLAIADGGTGASTATAAINNLLPSQTSNANKYLQTDGTNVSWDAVSLSTSDITGTLPVANGGTGVTSSTGTGSVVLSNSPTLVTPALGTPTSGVATNLTGLPLTTGVTGTLPIANGGTGQTTANAAFNALAPSQATASGKYLKSDGTNTSWDALDISTADITGTLPVANGGTGVTTSTGTGSVVLSNSPTLVTPALGTPSSATLTNATGLPISTGVSGLGTGVATALAVNVGSAGAPVVNGGALGTPSSGTVTNLTGTASININGTVGATTANTGNFTTLTTSSTVTLNGGTANGVTYLNGSKVLTSGSALTFDGTILGVGSGAGAGYGSLQVRGGFAYINEDGINTKQLYLRSNYGGSGPAIQVGGTDPLLFVINASEQMRLTSTGLGIGTSSPLEKLQVNGAILTTGSLSAVRTSAASLDFLSGNTRFISMGADASTKGGFIWYNSTNAAVTEGMRLDSAGNLGLGVTPSAWDNNFKAFQLGYPNFIAGNNGGNRLDIGVNAYFSTNYKYANTAAATYYSQASGTHSWYTAASGTAGTAISFTQAMTLDASGNLLVGNTADPIGSNRVLVQSAGTANNNRTFTVYNTAATSTTAFANRIAQLSSLGSGADVTLQFTDQTAYNCYIGMGSGNLYFATNGTTERARIDSSGNFLVGTTSQVNSTSRIASHVAAGNIGLETNSTSTANYYPAIFYNNTSTAGYIQVIGTATTYNSISDYRLKTVIGSVSGAGTRIDALEPIEYEWKSNGERTRGFLAHKFQEVYPQSVSGEKDAVDADGKPVYQAMQASTSEVIADLVAEIQSLRQRVAQLETN